MKLYSRLSALGAVLVVSAAFASADTISSSSSTVTFAGYSTTAPNPLTLPTGGTATFDLNPGTTWFGPFPGSTWVGSTATSGPVGVVNPAKGYYVYDYAFTPSAGAGVYSLSLALLADDTAEVVLNGQILIPFGGLGGDHHCADNAPGCDMGTIFTLPLTPVTLGATDNLFFVVRQAGFQGTGGIGNPSGVDFEGGITSHNGPPTTPEPNTLLLLGTGLIASAGALFRRKRL